MKRVAIFATVFFVLAGLFFLLEGPAEKRTEQAPELLLSGFSGDAVAALTLIAPEKAAVRLARREENWSVSSAGKTFSADAALIKTLLDKLAAIQAGTVASRNPGRHAVYEVTPETALVVTARDSDNCTLARVLIGKSGPDIFSTYVRRDGSDVVYLSEGILKTAADKSVSEWRDKTVFSLDAKNITGYRISGDRTLALQKTDGVWQVTAPRAFTPDAEAAKRVLRDFAGLKAADFSGGPLSEFQLDNPPRTITALLADGTGATLLIGKDKNGFQRYAKKANADTVFVVEKYLLDLLCPDPESLQAAPHADNETVKKQ